MTTATDAQTLFLQAMDALQDDAYEEATDLLYAALEHLQNASDAPDLSFTATIHLLLGQISADMGDIEQAREHLAMAHDLYRERNDPIGRARVRLELGELAFWEEQYGVAQKHYQRVLELLDDDQELEAQAMALMRLGAIAFEEDEIDQAHTYYERSLRLFEQLGDTLSAAGTTIELANILQSEKPDAAEQLFLKGYALANEAGSNYLASLAAHGLGVLAADRGDWQQARDHYRTAIDLKIRCGDHEGQIFTYLALGTAERELGHEAAARRAWQRAAELARREGMDEVEEIVQALMRSEPIDWVGH